MTLADQPTEKKLYFYNCLTYLLVNLIALITFYYSFRLR